MPKAPITRVSSMAVTPLSTNRNNGFYLPKLTATQIANIPAATLADGGMVQNTTTGWTQINKTAVWNNINYSVSTATGVGITAGSPSTLPSGVNATVDVAGNQVSGFMYYGTTSNTLRVYSGAAWNNINYSISTATGVGLTAGSPCTLPTGPDAAVEVAGNQVNGFIYLGATSGTIRARVGGAWVTVQVA